jgi:hypothetical protein
MLVSGVRSSCVTLLMKSSFSLSRLLSCSFTWRSSRRFLDDAQHVVQAQRVLFDHRGHHHARRRAADGAGQLRLHPLHQLARRPRGGDAARPGARIAGKQAPARARARGSAHQRQQVGHLGAAAPEGTRSCAGALEHVDEQQRLAGLARARRPAQRHRHVQRRRWPAGSRTARASGCPCRSGRTAPRAAAAPGRTGPAAESPAASRSWRWTAASACRPTAAHRRQPGQRAVARAALPVHAAQQRRRELRHRGKADQADADQRVGLAGDAEVQ